MDITPAIELNLKRLLCPLPVIRLQNAIKNLSKGTHIRVLCTDPGTLHDIPTWCRMYGHVIVDIEEKEFEFTFLVQV